MNYARENSSYGVVPLIAAAIGLVGTGVAAVSPHIGKKKQREQEAIQRAHEQQLAAQQLYLAQMQGQRTKQLTNTALYVGLALAGGVIIFALARNPGEE